MKKLLKKFNNPQERNKKISETCKKNGIGKWMIGKKHLKKTKIKMRKSHLGKRNHFYGKKHTNKTKQKISKSRRGQLKSKRAYTFLNGKKNPQWKGGISFEPYGIEFNKDLKEVIRNRDRRKCVLCEKTELEIGELLSIHHIDYNKQNNNPNNLISLCRNCHTKTNYNRDYWIDYFKKYD